MHLKRLLFSKGVGSWKLRTAETKKMLLAMKLTAIILLSACLTASAKGYTQISLSETNASLQKVFKEIKKQTGYSFLYKYEVLEKAGTVTVRLNNVTIEKAVEEVLKGTNLTYTIIDKTVVIKQRTAIPNEEATIISEPPPPIDITGKVTDENGNPLVGASVKVKGSSKGTTTNSDGVFTLKGVSDDAVLEISYVGFELLNVPVNNRTAIVTSLKAKPENLGEVVINKGYYTEKQKYSVSNVGQITAADIEKQPVQNPLLALQGRVPGIEVYQTTGMNGGGVQVRIQGINTLGVLNGLAKSDPLIVVDGVPYPSQFPSAISMEGVIANGSPLNYITPSDIELISVLKDADATAIYGSRAANGAILITTKKGKVGKPKLNFDVQQGWGKVARHVDMMNTRQYLDMRYEALKNDGIALSSLNQSWDYDLTVWDTTRYTDWQKTLIGGTAQYTNINAGVSGGTNMVQYLVGANFNRQSTVFPGDFANKTGGVHFSLNGSSPNQRLQIQLTGSYQYNQNQLPGIDFTRSAILLEPDAPKLYNADGSLNWALNASGSSTWTNPLINTSYAEFSNITKNLISSMNVAYAILPGLKLSSNFGYNDLRSDLFQGYKLEFNAPENRASSQRTANFGRRVLGSWIVEPQLQLGRRLGKGMLDVLIGATIQKTSGNYLIVSASGQPTNELLRSIAAATSVKGVNIGNNGDYITKFNGLFGRVGYNWDKKYLISLTARRDGSSKFGTENKFHNFWSAGAGWIFSEEKWIQSALPFLSFGKLRASYGTTGNDQIADYSYLSLYNIVNSNILYQGTTGFNVSGLSNPFLQWEETRKLQGGIDLSAFKERITFGVTFARNRTSNQLISYSLPDLTGFSGFTKNFPATVQNTSWEFSLNTVDVANKNFNWSSNLNLTIPQNNVINFPGIQLTSYASGKSGVIVGEPIGVKKLYLYGGVDPATGSYMLLDTIGKATVPTSFGSILQTAQVSLLPKFYGGISNTISYKRFQLDFLFQFVYQRGAKDFDYYNGTSVPGRYALGYSNQPASIVNDHWQKPGDIATIGRFTTDPSFSFTIWPYSLTNEGYSYSAGSYIRLKNVSFSWQLPDAWSNKIHLQTARIYFRGQNLATITKYAGLDPETRSIATLPPLRMLTIGARIEL